MVVLGRKESRFTWRNAAYVLVAAIGALVLLSWMHDPSKRTSPAVPEQQEQSQQQQHEPEPEYSPPEPEKEESYPFADFEQEPATTIEAFATSTSHGYTHTSSPTGKPIPMLNGEIVDGLTAEQCDEIFPELYVPIDRAVEYWNERGHTITKDDVEISYRKPWTEDDQEKGGGAMRLLIHQNEMRILESINMIGHMGYRGRGMGSLQLIERALYSAKVGGEMLPTIEFSMVVEDSSKANDEDSTHTFWTYAQDTEDDSHKRVWLMPNFDLWYAYPMGAYFTDARRRAMQHDKPFAEKIQKIVWRGGGWNNWELRGKLVEETEGKEWADVKVADWGGRESEYGMTQEALCKYAMTVHTEGVTYSGRLKFLMNCNSLMFVHDLQWATYYTHLLEAEGEKQNYVNVNREWTDLEEKVEYFFEHPDEADKIIENAVEKFRNKYMTQAATSCYIRKLIKGYASVSYTPEVNSTTPDGKDIVNMRGFSFQRFMDGPMDYGEDDYVDV